ncbi:MAG: DCC1-like thiol-disulfide oxidoreductase family protein [Myxococcota bacterium]
MAAAHSTVQADQHDRVPNEVHGLAIVFYDGVCGMCNRLTQLVLRLDRHRRVFYAPLQSTLAQRLLAPHGIDPLKLDSLVVLTRYGCADEMAWTRAAAVFELSRVLGGWLRVFSWLRVLPSFVSDLGYRLVAALRYRLMGRYETCPIPTAAERQRFLGL